MKTKELTIIMRIISTLVTTILSLLSEKADDDTGSNIIAAS